jgi:hypothetical protein
MDACAIEEAVAEEFTAKRAARLSRVRAEGR